MEGMVSSKGLYANHIVYQTSMIPSQISELEDKLGYMPQTRRLLTFRPGSYKQSGSAHACFVAMETGDFSLYLPHSTELLDTLVDFTEDNDSPPGSLILGIGSRGVSKEAAISFPVFLSCLAPLYLCKPCVI